MRAPPAVSLCTGISLLLLWGTSSVHGQPSKASTSYPTYWDAMNSEAELSTFRDLVLTLRLKSTVNNTASGYTAFLPTNSAFETFAASQGLNVSTLLASSDTTTLTRLALYHFGVGPVLRMGNDSNITPTTYTFPSLLINDWETQPTLLAPSARLSVIRPSTNVSQVTISSSAGTTAQLVMYDMVAGNGLIQIIDTVLVYWFNTIAEPLQKNVSYTQTAPLYPGPFYPAAEFVQGMKAGGFWGLLNDSTYTTNYTCFVPTSSAVNWAYRVYGESVMNTNLADIMSYHVALNSFLLLSDTATSTELTPHSYLRANTTSSEELTIKSVYGAPITIAGYGSSGRILTYVYPIGGIGATKSYVYLIDVVLMPVDTSIASYLTREKGYGMIGSLLAGSDSAIRAMKGFNGTFLAPSDLAISAFNADTAKYGYIQNSQSLTALLLQNHFVTPPVTLAALLTDGSVTYYRSCAGDVLQVTTRVTDFNGTQFGTVSVQDDRAKSACYIIGIGIQNIPIMYSSSFVSVLNVSGVLIPSGDVLPPPPPPRPPSPPSPQGGGAGLLAPSLLSLLLSAAASFATLQLLLFQLDA